MPIYYIVDLAFQLHLHFASNDNQLAILCRLSGISGMEQWNGIVEWNTGISIFDSLGYFPALQIFLKDVVRVSN